jgi:lysophospholipase L1-like esterase
MMLDIEQAGAASTDVCAAPAVLDRLTDALPKTRAALASGRPWRIIALGSSSTGGAGASAARYAYPSRLAVELAAREPNATLEIINRGINGEDVWENDKRLETDVIAGKPDLVIWQIGTNAVLHDIDYDDFDRTAQDGIDRMRAASIEILLMDLQYTPRVVEVPGHERMLQHLDALGARNRIPVFHRYAVMKFWADAMKNDYVTMVSSDGLHMDDKSYGCLAERLAEAIVGDPPVDERRRAKTSSIRADTAR